MTYVKVRGVNRRCFHQQRYEVVARIPECDHKATDTQGKPVEQDNQASHLDLYKSSPQIKLTPDSNILMLDICTTS
jgi:hypothetical protein